MRVLKNIDKWLLAYTVILFAIGTVMIFSASNVSAYVRYEASPYNYLIKQILILGLSLFASVVIMVFNTKTYGRVSTILTYLLLVTLFLLFIFGEVTNHARSWFEFGRFKIQPSEFLKVIMIVWTAKYYDLKAKKLDHYGVALYPLGIAFIAFLAIALQPDLGTALIFLSIFGFMFLLSSVSPKIKKTIVGIGVGLVLIVVLLFFSVGNSLLSERQRSRIMSVIEPSSPCSEENYYTDGNQICNGYIAINNGGLTGRGLGRSIQKYMYLPEAYTDFIFCVIVEELGLLFGIFIIILYILLLRRIILIGKKSLTNRDALICYGGAFYIFVHIMVNLFGVFGLTPMTGVPLPFMSYGGSYTLCLIALLTIIQRISFETNLKNNYELGKNR